MNNNEAAILAVALAAPLGGSPNSNRCRLVGGATKQTFYGIEHQLKGTGTWALEIARCPTETLSRSAMTPARR